MPPTDVNQALKHWISGGGGVSVDVKGEVKFFENSKKKLVRGSG